MLQAGLAEAYVAGAADAGDAGGLVHEPSTPARALYRSFQCRVSCPARAAATASWISLGRRYSCRLVPSQLMPGWLAGAIDAS